MPCLRLLDPETTHNLAVIMAKYRLVPKQKKPDPPSLVSILLRGEVSFLRKDVMNEYTTKFGFVILTAFITFPGISFYNFLSKPLAASPYGHHQYGDQ